MPKSLSRREFASRLSGAVALALAAANLRVPGVMQGGGSSSNGWIRLNFNENPYGPSPKAAEALASSGSLAARYAEHSREELTAALARLHGVNPENILLGCGSTEILRVADMTFLAGDKNFVVAQPTFEAVLDYAGLAHSKAVKIPLTRDHRHDLPQMAAACSSKTGLVYVCNPNNPTGTIVTRDEIASFIPGVPPTALILVDEAYFHFVENPRYSSALDWIGRHPNVLVARTFSKVYGLAGMRLGYAVGSKETIAAMSNQPLQDNVNSAVIPAVLASLADEENVARSRDRLNATRRWLTQQLSKEGRTYIPSETNFVMIDVGGDVEPVIQRFRDKKILVGRRFPAMNHYLRVTIGTQPEMEAFLAALQEIAPARSAAAA